MVIDLLFITVVVVFIIDLSGVITKIKHLISLILTNGKIIKDNYSIKPFDCSLCMTFWIGLIYISLVKFTLLNLCLVCLFAFFTTVIKDILYLLKDIIIILINKIYKKYE